MFFYMSKIGYQVICFLTYFLHFIYRAIHTIQNANFRLLTMRPRPMQKLLNLLNS